MTVPQIVLSIIYFIVALALVAVVMLQSGKSAGRRRPSGPDDQVGGYRVHGAHPGAVPAALRVSPRSPAQSGRGIFLP